MPSLSRFMFVISCYCFVLLTTGRTTDPKEVDALLAIKKTLVDPTNRLKDWKDGDPCRSNWTGVICFDAVGTDGYLHVGELLLMKKNLAGNLAPELGKLSALRILDFMWNNLTGLIPKEIGQLSSLRLLLLNGNKLSGSLPPELGSLSNLDRFQIDENNISGPVPTSYANLSSLKHLHFNNNSISGQVPAELSKLPKLIHVLLDNNNLSGILPPQLSDVSGLLIVQLDNNNFTGSDIPASYGNFSRLLKLSLRNCGLQGTIPDFSMSPQLKYLDLSRNSLTGAIPSTKLSDTITTIDLSGNNLNGSIPESYSDFPSLQKLSLANNFLSGSIPAGIWQNMSFTKNARLLVDLRNNLFSDLPQDLNTPKNVTLRLGGNPVCSKTNTVSIDRVCKLDDKDETLTKSNSTKNCPVQSCPLDDFYEYVPESPLPCFCASPLRIGYRLKSPSFSYFPPLINQFQEYIARELNLDLYQLSIDSYDWEGGPRLRMYLKLFPNIGGHKHSNKFNASEVLRIRDVFTSWSFNGSDIFGPYELLNFTLVGPYNHGISMTHRTGISDSIMVAITGGAVAVAVLLSVIATLLFLKNHTKHHRQNSRGRLSSRISMNLEGVRDFTYKELAKATDNFSSSAIIGRGGYGKVYKGTLCDKTVVAIKRAEEGSLQGQKEFLNEIKLLSRLHHRNLVSLVGYCDEEDEQMLVYEFMPNGTLRDWLSAKTKTLNFNMRLSVALGSAKGLLYLHTEANPPVFHRDVKATNILLDSKLNAKVADFGLSRLAPFLEDEGNVPNYVSTVVRGTPGYLDPEYFLTNKLTDKSDVYSLGVVFLELLTGMHPIMHGKNIVREVNVAFQSGLMFSIIDNKIGPYTSECVERFAALALNCCQDYPEKRPYMADVVRELENIQKTLQEIEGSSLSEFASLLSGKSFSSSSSYTTRDQSSCTTRDQAVSLNIMGSDLISGVIPSISPR